MVSNKEKSDRCRKLWVAVVDSAVRDLKIPKDRGSPPSGNTITALSFLFTGESDDRIEMSGFSPEWVRRKVISEALKGEGTWRHARQYIYSLAYWHSVAPDCQDQLDRFFEFMRGERTQLSAQRRKKLVEDDEDEDLAWGSPFGQKKPINTRGFFGGLE